MTVLILLTVCCVVLAVRGRRNADRLRKAERDLYYYRRSICEGDIIRLPDGRKAKVTIAGVDGVYYRQDGELKRIDYKEIVSLNLN